MTDSIQATYLIETDQDIRRAAEVMAGEQSAGTFVKVPGETPELLEQHGAKIEEIASLEDATSPSLPRRNVPAPGTIFHRAQVRLSFPYDNIGPSLTALWTAVAGNLFELAPFTGLRLLDIEIPPSFGTVYPGPAFGIEGTRELANVHKRPLIGTIVKPSIGLSIQETAELVKTLCDANVDFIKDDELQSNAPYAPFTDRVDAVMRVINNHAEHTGKKVMYAFNVTGDLDAMRHAQDYVVQRGGTCVMVNMIAVGLAGLIELRRHSQLPIHGHRAGWGLFTRDPHLGMEYVAFQKFFRLAGVDHLHVNGLSNKFCETDESVTLSAKMCLTPMPGLDCRVMPVFSSGQWAGQAPETYQALGSVDLLYLAGGGIMAHPGGPAAGVRSIQQAWEAAINGVPLREYAAANQLELRQALDKFGSN